MERLSWAYSVEAQERALGRIQSHNCARSSMLWLVTDVYVGE
jgi:hypothetical protein